MDNWGVNEIGDVDNWSYEHSSPTQIGSGQSLIYTSNRYTQFDGGGYQYAAPWVYKWCPLNDSEHNLSPLTLPKNCWYQVDCPILISAIWGFGLNTEVQVAIEFSDASDNLILTYPLIDKWTYDRTTDTMNSWERSGGNLVENETEELELHKIRMKIFGNITTNKMLWATSTSYFNIVFKMCDSIEVKE